MQTRHFASKGLCLLLAVLGTANASYADTYETPPAPRPMQPVSETTGSSSSATVAPGKDGRLQVSAPTDTQPAQTNSTYIMSVAPRAPMTGYSVSVFGGASLAQEDDITNFGGLPANSDHEVSPMGGLKLGYVWPFSDEPIDQFEMETSRVGGVRLSGGLEVEGFYISNSTEITTPAGATTFDMDMGFLMLNATLQAQWGDFRIYGGPGVGLAIIGTDDDLQGELAYQILGGLDYFITPDWSVFGEYRYLIVNRLVATSSGGEADFGDQFGQHILSMGLRKHF